MAVFNNIIAGASGATGAAGFQIDRSLRFNSADSAYLNRTPSSAGNRKTWTYSVWLKRSKLGGYDSILGTSNDNAGLRFDPSTNRLELFEYSGSYVWQLLTDQVFRDVSSWYHIVFALDTTQATAADRAKLYVNGTQVTQFATSNYPAQNYEGPFNNNTEQSIGDDGAGHPSHFDGYLADVHFIDGQALAPTDFGEFDANGVWQPKEYSGQYNEPIDQSQNWTNLVTFNAGTWNGNGTNPFNADPTDYDYGDTTRENNGYATLDLSSFSGAKVISVTAEQTELTLTHDGGTTVYTPPNTSRTTHTFASVDNPTSLKFDGLNSNSQFVLVGVSVDGKRLVNSNITVANNGFHLDFSDNSSDDALGTDSSGNSNDWTVNNLSADGPSVTTTGNISLSSANRSFYFKGASGQSISVSLGNHVWDSSDGTSWTYRGTSDTTVSLTNNYVLVSGTTDITFTNSGSASVKYWDLALSTGITNGAGTTATFNVEAYGAGNIDSLIDSPTNYEASSGNNGGNYATLNPLEKSSDVTLSNGNLDASLAIASGWRSALGTFDMSSGKWYFEFTLTQDRAQVGICGNGTTRLGTYLETDSTAYVVQTNSGTFYTGSSGSVSTGLTFGVGDVVNIAYDADNTSIWIGKNGTWSGSGNPSAGTGAVYTSAGPGTTGRRMMPGISLIQTSSCNLNFGQRPFAISSIPTGYKSLCTTNLPDPTIEAGSQYFDIDTYDGTSSTLERSEFSFEPNFVWIKQRNNNGAHMLFDSVRGVKKRLVSNQNLTEGTVEGVTSFDPDGFTLGDDADCNFTTKTHVAWAWDGGTGSPVSNTDGSITSSVRANASAGFSIVGYTGNGTSGATVGHGLNDELGWLIVKNRSTAVTSPAWGVKHSGLYDTSGKWLELETSDAAVTESAGPGALFEATNPTSSVFTLGDRNTTNTNGDNYIAYCWAPVEGYSAFGSYTGNGSNDGPFVFTNFRPALVICKPTTTTGSWQINDSARNTFNVADEQLFANESIAATTTTNRYIDFLSNGFKVRGNNASFNGSGDTYIYAAFAEHPFKTARAR